MVWLNYKQKIKPIILIMLAVLFSSCVTLTEVKRFGDSTELLVNGAEKHYDQILVSHRNIVLENIDLSTDSFDDAVETNLLKGVIGRKVVMSSLYTYSKALKDLADFDSDKDIERASKQLSSSLNSLTSGIISHNIRQELPDFLQSRLVPNKLIDGVVTNEVQKQLRAIGPAIEKLAMAYVNVKKKSEIRKAVIDAQPHLENIVTFLKKDLLNESKRLMMLQYTILMNNSETFDSLKEDYSNQSHAEKANRTVLAKNIVKGFYNQQDQWIQEVLFLIQLENSADRCLTAHKNLMNKNDKGKALSDFIGSVNILTTLN